MCALTSGGAVKCWGQNGSGQLGDGTTNGSDTAVDVTGLSSGVTSIAAGGNHSCAVDGDENVQCWGANDQGQLGDGTTVTRQAPVPVIYHVDIAAPTVTVATDASPDGNAGWFKTAPVTGTVTADDTAQGGSNVSAIDCNVPVTPSGLGTPSATAAFTINTDGVTNVSCTATDSAANTSSATAIDVKIDTHAPVISINTLAAKVAVGGSHACALTTGGGAKCWGAGGNGQLGNFSFHNATKPVDVLGVSSNGAEIAAGQFHSCAVTTGGAVECWGQNLFGQLGTGNTTGSSTPVVVIGSGAAQVAAGDSHTCALMTSGAVKCWGRNNVGQLGTGNNTIRFSPTDVPSLSSGVVAISAGGSETCVVTSAGAVECWGSNNDGQLGDGTKVNRNAPVSVNGLSAGVAAISVGGSHACAVMTAGGAAECWGLNSGGQLGDGTVVMRLTPVGVSGLSSGVAAISAGASHTCARTIAAAAECWGTNASGQLGDGTTTKRLSPVAVTGLSSNVADIDAGGSNSCAALTTGFAKCWGANASGQVGDGTTTLSRTAGDVNGLPAACDTPGTNGWCRHQRSVAIAVIDVTSHQSGCNVNVVQECDVTGTVTTNGSGETISIGTFCDVAGNCVDGTDVVGPFKIDSGVPTLSPAVSGAVVLGATANVLLHATDPLVDGFAVGHHDPTLPARHYDGRSAHRDVQGQRLRGNAATHALSYVVQYKVTNTSPVANSNWVHSHTVPIKVNVTNAANVKLTDTQAKALLTPTCRVKVSAAGVQTLASTCMTYDTIHHQFVFNWNLGAAKGAETITVTITYAGTTTKTTKPVAVHIT